MRVPQRLHDEYLVLSVQQGDAQAWTSLVRHWQPRLLAHAWRLLGDAERARDAVQESWLQILRGIRSLSDVAAFPAWALRIVTRRCQRHYTAQDQRRTHEAEWSEAATDTVAPDDSDPSAQPSHHDQHRLRAAIAALPAAQRSTLGLFYLDQLSVAEIAVALDVPPGTVKTRLLHARRSLRAILEGVDHEPSR